MAWPPRGVQLATTLEDILTEPLNVVVRRGPGPSVLLLHGLTASHASWMRVAEELDRFCLIIPDLLGFGESPKPHGNYDLDAHCSALAVTVQEHRPVLVAGHSMGAVIALGLLERHPDLIQSGVLVSPAVYSSREHAAASMREAPLLQRALVRSPRLAQAVCMTVCMLRPMLRPFAPLLARDLPAEVARAGLDHSWESYSKSIEGIVLADLIPGLLERVEQPVTVVHGRSDLTVPLANIEELGALVQKLTVIEGDHEAILKNCGPIAQAIVDSAAL